MSGITIVLTHLMRNFFGDLFGHLLRYRVTLLYRDILTDLMRDLFWHLIRNLYTLFVRDRFTTFMRNLDWDFPAVCFRYVVALLQGNLDRVLDRNIMTLFPGIHVTFFVVSVSVTTFFMINMTLLLHFVLVLDGVALLARFVILGVTLVLVLGEIVYLAHRVVAGVALRVIFCLVAVFVFYMALLVVVCGAGLVIDCMIDSLIDSLIFIMTLFMWFMVAVLRVVATTSVPTH